VFNDVLSEINIAFGTFSHLQKSGDHNYKERSTRLGTHCKTLQHTVTHCKHTATHCNGCTSYPTPFFSWNKNATPCNTLQLSATHCHTMQHTALHPVSLEHTAAHYHTLQHTVTNLECETDSTPASNTFSP